MELETDAGLRLWLAPDWARPETWLGALSTYLRVAHPRGSTCLCLATGDTDPAVVTELVSAACDRLAGDTPFGEVLIVAAPAAPPGEVVRVGSASEVLAALAAPPPATAPGPDDVALAGDLATELAAMTAAPPPAGTEPWLRDVRRVVPYR
jgi:hypothetical protein